MIGLASAARRSGIAKSTAPNAGTIGAAEASSTSILVTEQSAASGGYGAITGTLYRHTASFTPPGTGTSLGTSMPVTDTGRTAGVPYFYRRYYVDALGANVLSNEVSVTIEEVPGVTPDIEEDFSTYSSTANMLADPRGIYSEGEDIQPSLIVLDTGQGYGGSTKCMRYDYPDQTGAPGKCNSQTIGRNINFSAVNEIWLEVNVKFPSNWSAIPSWIADCTSNPDFKFLFGRMTVSSRFELLWGNSAGKVCKGGYPGNETAYNLGMGAIVAASFDDAWHQWRFHWKYSTTVGIWRFAYDGVQKANYTNIAMPSGKGLINGVALGRNRNQGADSDQSLRWGLVRVWYAGNDPGWVWV